MICWAFVAVAVGQKGFWDEEQRVTKLQDKKPVLKRLADSIPWESHDYVWADSAYSGECFDALLSLGGFESLIHEKGARNHPLSDAAKELNRLKSSIRACVEHVFGCMTPCQWVES